MAAREGLALGVVREIAGLCLDPKYRRLGGEWSRHLGVLVRDNPSHAAGATTDRHWLCAALSARPAFGSGFLVTQWLRLGYKRQSAVLLDEWVQRFWRRYCEALLTPCVVLMAKYGVALEGTPNTLMIRRRRPPCRLVRIATCASTPSSGARATIDFFPTTPRILQARRRCYTALQMHVVDILQPQIDGSGRRPVAGDRETLGPSAEPRPRRRVGRDEPPAAGGQGRAS